MSNTAITSIAKEVLPFRHRTNRTAKLLLWAARCNDINGHRHLDPGTNRRQIDSTTRKVYTQLSGLQLAVFDKLDRRQGFRSCQGTPVRRNRGRAR